MNKELQRIKIAEACGWEKVEVISQPSGTYCGWFWHLNDPEGRCPDTSAPNDGGLPDYLNSLDEICEAEQEVLGEGWSELWYKWERVVAEMAVGRGSAPLTVWIAKMTASQRAEALLKTLILWEEDE
jgi:hypothetical protein